MRCNDEPSEYKIGQSSLPYKLDHKSYEIFFLMTVGAGTSHRSQILFLMGLRVSTLSSH